MAEELFEQKCNFYYEKINSFTKQFDLFLVCEELEETKKTVLLNKLKQYEEQYNIFSHFLYTTRSDKSMEELMTLQIMYDKYSYKIHKFCEPYIDNQSVASRVSKRQMFLKCQELRTCHR